MAEHLHDLGNGFYNIRGDFRLGGVLNIGTHCSLIQLDDDRYVFIDSYALSGHIKDKVMAMTDDGKRIEAVLNVHPFHTVHCEQMATDFPNAKFYGSARHKQQVPSVNWQTDAVESSQIAALYPQLRFSLPQGIHYIHPNDKVHAGSLLVYHPASQVMHVDDTFNILPHYHTLQKLANKLDKQLPKLMFHPTTKMALTDDADALDKFCAWAKSLATQWQDARHLCAAHSELVRFNNGEFERTLTAAAERLAKKA